MKIESLLEEALHPYAPRQLDASTRGSGLNAVRQIQMESGPAILKTYASRRGPVKTLFSCLDHLITGRSGYSARARNSTERRNLTEWKAAGLDVPAIIDHRFSPPLPLPHLCMEYIPGPLLSAQLQNSDIPLQGKSDLFCAFLRTWGQRHDLALNNRKVSLLQEHASFEHVIVQKDRFITFDLEVSYVGSWDILGLIAREICGYMRSLIKHLDPTLTDHFLKLLISEYPEPTYIKAIPEKILYPPSPGARLITRLDQKRSRYKNKKNDKFFVATRIAELIGKS